MFRAHGLEDRVVGGVPTQPVLNFRIDGETRPLALDASDQGDGRFCPQQVLVRNLIEVFLADGGDLRFSTEISIENLDRPLVRCADNRTIACEFIAGCDGDRGASRAAIPDLTRYTHEYGYAWLTVLAEVPGKHQSMMASTTAASPVNSPAVRKRAGSICNARWTVLWRNGPTNASGLKSRHVSRNP